MSNYGLNPVHYYTAPRLLWDVLLKYTCTRVELITDPRMLEMIKSGIRGGIVQAAHRRGIANNRYLPDYDPSIPSSYIMYYNAVNLYGWSMMQPMPVSGHNCVHDVSDWDTHHIHDLTMRDSHGYLIEVNLDYLEHLHNLNNELPFLPELMDSKLTNNLLNKRLSHSCSPSSTISRTHTLLCP